MGEEVWFQLGNLKIGPLQAVIFAWALVILIVILKLSRMYWSRRLRQWAEGQHLELVSFRRGRFYEGPSAWRRSRNQSLFRVITRDGSGLERTCWMLFGTYWGFTWNQPLTQVTWIDDDA